MKATDPPIQLEFTYQSPVSTLWNAFTDVKLMRQWYFDNIPSFKAEVGFETTFPVEAGDKVFTHIWKINEAIPERKLAHTWNFKEYPGDSVVTFSFSEWKEGTKINLHIDVTETYPQDVPEFHRESCIGGWNYFLGQRLKHFLESGNS